VIVGTYFFAGYLRGLQPHDTRQSPLQLRQNLVAPIYSCQLRHSRDPSGEEKGNRRFTDEHGHGAASNGDPNGHAMTISSSWAAGAVSDARSGATEIEAGGHRGTIDAE
jgi:hypothetical protein